ncbi:MAG: ATP-dependent Clp protease adaptor ClpS [Bacteroidales bacterium]
MVKHKDNPSTIHQDKETLKRGLILFNDDVNTFDFVIKSLIEVCNHEHEQAEQCAIVTHFKGKCNIKNGDYYEIKPMYDEMTFRGLTVSIE